MANSKQNKKAYDVNKIEKMNTSQIIRYLASCGLKNNEIYNELKQLNITTKSGGEIRYQHVRNVIMTKLSTEK